MTDSPGDYGQLMQQLFGTANISRQPLSGAFELTTRCNLSCEMCYVRHPPGDEMRKTTELSAAGWLAIAEQAVDSGMLFLLLTGGEVFLRPDFFDIYDPLTRLGVVITLFTNGTLITPGIGERLALAPPSRIDITLYGATARTYEAVTGVPGSYAACCRGIETLLGLDIPLVVKATATRRNAGELDAMRDMARSWGAPFTNSWLLTRRTDGEPSDVSSCRLPCEDCAALEAAVDPPGASWTRDVSAVASVFNCNGGKASFAVTAAGEMSPCLDLPLPAARPLEIGFRAAWEEVVQYVDAAPGPSPVCRDCEDREFCLICPGWSYLETGTLDRPAPYLCDLARARKERFRKDV